jgi:hypothetical protein
VKNSLPAISFFEKYPLPGDIIKKPDVSQGIGIIYKGWIVKQQIEILSGEEFYLY